MDHLPDQGARRRIVDEQLPTRPPVARPSRLRTSCTFRAPLRSPEKLAAPGFGEDAVYADQQLVITYAFRPAGLRFSGEIDASNLNAVVQTLETNLPDGDIHFELSQLSFCDVDGIRALVSVAEHIEGAHHLVLHGMAPQLRTALSIVGWGQAPQLVLCPCGGRT